MDLKNMIVDYIFNDEMKDKIIKELNENVDIPIISEKTEEKILSAIYDSVEEVIKNAILKSQETTMAKLTTSLQLNSSVYGGGKKQNTQRHMQ